MPIKRTVICNVCEYEFTETSPAGDFGDGFPNWININGLTNLKSGLLEQIWLCPKDSIEVAKFLTTLKAGNK